MRAISLTYPRDEICQTASGLFDGDSIEAHLRELLTAFPLAWSAYMRLLSIKNMHAREFYKIEALRGGWSVRQLTRQIMS